jgi:Holliday junction resolvase
MPSNTPEGKIKATVDRILKRNAVWYFKPVSNGMGTHGIPDYIACVPPNGKLLAIECKGTAAGKPTELQQAQLDRISQHGGHTFVATPATVHHLEIIIAKLAYESD